MMFRLFIIFFLVFFLPKLTFAEDRALIIGINAYQERPLQGCRTDAENMEGVIQEVWHYKSQQIRTLLDKEATRQGILSTFDDWLIKGTQAGDRVIFYYSGHGYHLRDDNGDEKDGQDEVLCPIDSESKPSNMIRDDEINARLQKLSGRQVIFISDSCHSGTITRAFGKPSAKVKKLFLRDETRLKPSVRSVGHTEPTNNFVKPLNHVIAYSAVSPSQLAIDGGPQKGGVFTNAFTRAIRGQADRNRDGKTTHAEVLAYVRSETQAHCDKNRDDCEDNNGRLTPQLDANPKWMATDITSKDTAPPSFSSSASDTMQVAQTLDTENTAQLRLQMLPSTTFRLGEKMQVNVSSQRTGYLFVLDIDSAGKMTVLFPNKYSEKRNRKGILKAQQTVKIPDINYGFDFLAQEPVGQGLLLTLLIEEEEAFIQGLRRKLPSPERGFAVVQRTSQVQSTLARLHQQLRKTIVESDGVGRPIKWSMVGVEYKIER